MRWAAQRRREKCRSEAGTLTSRHVSLLPPRSRAHPLVSLAGHQAHTRQVALDRQDWAHSSALAAAAALSVLAASR